MYNKMITNLPHENIVIDNETKTEIELKNKKLMEYNNLKLNILYKIKGQKNNPYSELSLKTYDYKTGDEIVDIFGFTSRVILLKEYRDYYLGRIILLEQVYGSPTDITVSKKDLYTQRIILQQLVN